MMGARRPPLLCLCVGLLLCVGSAMAANKGKNQGSGGTWRLICAAPAKGDPVIAYSPLYGHANMSDSAWHDDTPAFLEHGPITAMTLYYSVGWHDPFIGWHEGGEFKGIQPVYGTETNDSDLLFGAKKPHKPFNFSLEPDEAIVRVDLEHDSVMRWMAFTTNKARRYEWGYKDVPGAVAAAVPAPRDGAYLAAIRGFEGKQLPPELGGYKKRYIIQVGFAWAMPKCSAYEWTPPPQPPGAPPLATPPAPPFAPVVPLAVAPAPPMPPPVPPPPPVPTPDTVAAAADGPAVAAPLAASAAAAAAPAAGGDQVPVAQWVVVPAATAAAPKPAAAAAAPAGQLVGATPAGLLARATAQLAGQPPTVNTVRQLEALG